jgi:deoxycytidylate deaminase
MAEALKESLKSNYRRVNIGAVLVVGNYLAARGANLDKAHPLQYKYNERSRRPPSSHKLHAEVHALINSKQLDLTNGTVYVGRLDRNGTLAMCRPCKACRMALRKAGISTMIYTTPQGVKHESL